MATITISEAIKNDIEFLAKIKERSFEDTFINMIESQISIEKDNIIEMQKFYEEAEKIDQEMEQ